MATERLQMYKCEKCGMIVEVLDGGAGTLVCCGQPMTQLTENTTDAAKEKHVPVVEAVQEGTKVAVGSVAHPMEDTHYIELIELIDGQSVYRKYLKPGDAPEAVFAAKAEGAVARAYCNIHGLWRK
jgi:superoxide reductase